MRARSLEDLYEALKAVPEGVLRRFIPSTARITRVEPGSYEHPDGVYDMRRGRRFWVYLRVYYTLDESGEEEYYDVSLPKLLRVAPELRGSLLRWILEEE